MQDGILWIVKPVRSIVEKRLKYLSRLLHTLLAPSIPALIYNQASPNAIPTVQYQYTYHTPTPHSIILQPQKSHRPHSKTLDTIQLRPHIQVKIQLLPNLPLVPPRIKINHILDFGPAPIHHPIVPIKRRLVPQQGVEARARGEGRGEAGEGGETRSAAAVYAESK